MVGAILVDVVRNVKFVVSDGYWLAIHYFGDMCLHLFAGGKGEGPPVVAVGPGGHHGGCCFSWLVIGHGR